MKKQSKQLQELANASLMINSHRSPADVAQAVTHVVRDIIGAHQASTGFTVDANWGQAVQGTSLSDKYAAWRNYEGQPNGSGIYSVVCQTNRPLRLTQAQLEAHPRWRAFGNEAGRHPPMRGLLAAPLVANDGRNIGVVILSDKYEGDFTADDEAILVQLAQMASLAIENAWLFEEVTDSNERLRVLSGQLIEVQEQERRHLARELHDEVGQLLTGLRMSLNADRTQPPDSATASDVRRSPIDQSRAIVDELISRVRGLSFDLRPDALDQLGLVPALLTLIERYTDQTGIAVNFKHHGVEDRFSPEVETTAYRIAQETLTNVARHSGAATATVRVWASEGVLTLQIEDQGRGFEPAGALARFNSSGLGGMKERVRLLNGHLSIESQPGIGTEITAEIPLNRIFRVQR